MATTGPIGLVAQASTCSRSVDYTVERSRQLETIQVVLDKKVLQATDRAALLRTNRNRSALVRDALREHLRRLTIQSLEERDRAGYSERPSARDESAVWESEAAWPKE
jgi:metal-responsive CopG/Arc/MetJ family transcriptional regulator